MLYLYIVGRESLRPFFAFSLIREMDGETKRRALSYRREKIKILYSSKWDGIHNHGHPFYMIYNMNNSKANYYNIVYIFFQLHAVYRM